MLTKRNCAPSAEAKVAHGFGQAAGEVLDA